MYLVCSKKFRVYFPPAAPHHGTVQPNIGDRPILPGCRQLTLGALYSHFTVISDLRLWVNILPHASVGGGGQDKLFMANSAR